MNDLSYFLDEKKCFFFLSLSLSFSFSFFLSFSFLSLSLSFFSPGRADDCADCDDDGILPLTCEPNRMALSAAAVASGLCAGMGGGPAGFAGGAGCWLD